MAITIESPPVVTPSEADAEALHDLDHALEMVTPSGSDPTGVATLPAALLGPNGEHVPIPASICNILHEVVHRMARGESISLVPIHKELTTQQAADILNISRPFLVKLLDRGEIPYERPNSHRRIMLKDVLAYREKRAKNRRASIERLAAKSQLLGKY